MAASKFFEINSDLSVKFNGKTVMFEKNMKKNEYYYQETIALNLTQFVKLAFFLPDIREAVLKVERRLEACGSSSEAADIEGATFNLGDGRAIFVSAREGWNFFVD